MNHLAHALLGADNDDLMFGSLIADFVRGGIDSTLPTGVRNGIVLHRAVDVFTDAHPHVAAARALFDPPHRRYAGILLDIWFDHLLARDWTIYGEDSLPAFSRRMQRLLDARSAERPPRMRDFARYMQAHDLPLRYLDLDMIERVLHGVAQRLSRANPLADGLPELQARAAPLDQHFAAFFPDLVAYAASERRRLSAATAVDPLS
jgi:acyl carrier protein phosphodiesterase